MKLNGWISEGAVQRDNQTLVRLTLYGGHADEINAMKDKTLDIEIKRHRLKRSLSANALCWEICSQIGRAINPPMAKEDVYRRAIKDVGEFVQMTIRREDYPAFERTWRSNGVGWFAEITNHHQAMDSYEVMAYYGSSVYDGKAMSILIGYLIDEAQQMELTIGHTLTEIDRIVNEWAKNDKEAKPHEQE